MRNSLTVTKSIALLTLIFMGTLQNAWAANNFTYAVPTPDRPGRFNGEIALTRIGNVVLPRGLATFSGDELSIRAVPEWLFDRSTVLKGTLVRAEGVQQGSTFLLGGLVIFLDGIWLNNLQKKGSDEVVDTMDGAKLRGRITGKTGESLTIETVDGKNETIAFDKIKSISSSRAFTFNLSTSNVKINPVDSAMSFDATELVLKNNQLRQSSLSHGFVPKSQLRGTEPGITKTALATYLGLDMLTELTAPIAIPLVLNARNQRAAKNRISETVFQNFTSAIAPSPAPATTSSGSTSGQ